MCIYLYTCTPYIANNTHHRTHYICIGTAQYLLPSIPGNLYQSRLIHRQVLRYVLPDVRSDEVEATGAGTEQAVRSGKGIYLYLYLFFGKCARKMPGTPAFDLSNLHHNSSPFRGSYGSYAGCCRFPSQGYVHEDCSCRVTVEQP